METIGITTAADRAACGDPGSHPRVLRAHRQGEPPDAQGGDRPLQEGEGRRRQGPQEAGREEPEASGQRGQALPWDGAAFRGPHPGGQRRPHAGRREVRPRPRLEVLHVRDVVDPPGRAACRCGQGPDHPGPRAHGRQDPEDGPRLQRALRRASTASPPTRRSPGAWSGRSTRCSTSRAPCPTPPASTRPSPPTATAPSSESSSRTSAPPRSRARS